nr:2-amino-4-hydroxy-6-hydroxymethyldihydropteridine diphosphokinase [Aquabacterium olei]
MTHPVAPDTQALSRVPRHLALVGMGGNLGDMRARLARALEDMNGLPGTAVVRVSSLYETAPVDATGPDFINAVAVLSSALGPQELLAALLALETAHDRERPYRHAPRTLDLDLLWYGDAARCTSSLTLPHPRMMARAFVLEPLVEVLDALAAEGGSVPVLPLPDVDARKQLRDGQGIRRL